MKLPAQWNLELEHVFNIGVPPPLSNPLNTLFSVSLRSASEFSFLFDVCLYNYASEKLAFSQEIFLLETER